MKARYRLICRGIRGGAYYCVDTKTGKRTSLGTTNADDARQVIEAKNNAERQPVLNLQIAKCMLEILRAIARRECRAMRDPYRIAGNIPAVKTASQRERSLASVANSRDHSQSAFDAEGWGDLQEARRQWDIVFNGNFPW
jgi:hypothetical protein